VPNAEPYILFELAGTAYGIRSQLVQRMEMVEHITPVPNAPSYVDGIMFSRGRVVPALNLRLRFGIDRAPYDAKTRLIVVTHQERTVGLIVDVAREFIGIPESAIQPLPDTLAATSGNYLSGIATINEKVILLVEIGELLKDSNVAPVTASHE
jgi:purine-binding chemotaxis protein CheW